MVKFLKVTKYVIQSGNIKRYPDKARKFFSEVFLDLGKTPNFLICLFATPREDWEGKFEEDKSVFKGFFKEGVSPNFDLAIPDTFSHQVSRAGAIYIHGGDDHLMMYWLRKFDLPEIWQGKVVSTSSASSHALSKSFWTCDWRACMEGLGILPIKFIAHYKSDYGANDPRGPIDWDKAYKDLKNYDDKSLPIYALPEGEYEVFNTT